MKKINILRTLNAMLCLIAIVSLCYNLITLSTICLAAISVVSIGIIVLANKEITRGKRTTT